MKDVPNLDCLSNRELLECSKHYETLSQYSELILSARLSRLSGAVQSALKMENEAERLYSTLPEDWRW